MANTYRKQQKCLSFKIIISFDWYNKAFYLAAGAVDLHETWSFLVLLFVSEISGVHFLFVSLRTRSDSDLSFKKSKLSIR